MRVTWRWWARLARLTGRLPPGLVTLSADAALAVAAAVANAVRIAASGADGPRHADALAFVIGVAMAAGLVVRRRWPLATLLWVWAWWFSYHVLDYPGGAPAVPMWIALYTAAAAEHRRGAVTAAVYAHVFLSDILGRAQAGSVVFLNTTLDSSTIVWVAMVLLGDAVRSRRKLRAETAARLAQAAAEQEREAERRVADERLRIARELHDVTAHTISVIAVQAGVAAETVEDDPEHARAALGAIRAASREAMDELSATVGMLRQPGQAGTGQRERLAPMPGLDQLPELLAMARRSGLPAELVVDGTPRRLPAALDLTAYRSVQEALTNVLRHAHANRATVTVTYQPDGVLLEVDDDGTGPPSSKPATPGGRRGYGLTGMRERAEAVGGSVRTGRGPHGGFQVGVWLPTGARQPRAAPPAVPQGRDRQAADPRRPDRRARQERA